MTIIYLITILVLTVLLVNTYFVKNSKDRKKICNIVRFISCFILLLLVVACIIYELYHNGYISGKVFNASDTLSFFIDVVSVSATVVLGILAYKISKQLADLEEQRHIAETNCNVIIENYYTKKSCKHLSNELHKKKKDNKSSTKDNNQKLSNEKSDRKLVMIVKNYSDAFLNKIEFRYNGKKIFVSHVIVAKGEPITYNVNINDLENPNLKVGDKIDVTFISCYNKKTYADFEIWASSEEKTSKNIENDKATEANEVNHNLSVQHYHFYGSKKPARE